MRGNPCYGNRRAGIGIRTGKETRPLVEDNHCYANEMSGIGVEEARQQIDESAFSASIWSDDCQRFPVINTEADVAQDGLRRNIAE